MMRGAVIRGFAGSPPRVRGILENKAVIVKGKRITPACAGNTKPQLVVYRHGWDHPRVCGEYPFQLLRRKLLIGSPPRVRGIPRPCEV